MGKGYKWFQILDFFPKYLKLFLNKRMVQRQVQSGIQLKGRSQGPTLLLRLRSAHKTRPIRTALPKTQQAAERVRCRYLYPTNGQKEAADPCCWIRDSWKKLRRRAILWEDHQSQLIWTPEISQTLDHRTDSIYQLIWGPQYMYNRGLLDLFSFRDDAPNSQETGGLREFRDQVGWGMGISTWRRGGVDRRYEMCSS